MGENQMATHSQQGVSRTHLPKQQKQGSHTIGVIPGFQQVM